MREDLAFFLDRGLGSRSIAIGLRDAGWCITTMDDRYGKGASQSIADETWIRDATERDEILLTKDRMIAKRPLEAEVIAYCSARVFVVASAQITGAQMLARLIGNAAAIEGLARRGGPWVFAVYEERLRELRLAGR